MQSVARLPVSRRGKKFELSNRSFRCRSFDSSNLVQKLERSDASFKEFHFGVLDLIDEAKQDD